MGRQHCILQAWATVSFSNRDAGPPIFFNNTPDACRNRGQVVGSRSSGHGRGVAVSCFLLLFSLFRWNVATTASSKAMLMRGMKKSCLAGRGSVCLVDSAFVAFLNPRPKEPETEVPVQAALPAIFGQLPESPLRALVCLPDLTPKALLQVSFQGIDAPEAVCSRVPSHRCKNSSPCSRLKAGSKRKSRSRSASSERAPVKPQPGMAFKFKAGNFVNFVFFCVGHAELDLRAAAKQHHAEDLLVTLAPNLYLSLPSDSSSGKRTSRRPPA